MKNVLVLFFLLPMLFSCQKEEINQDSLYPQTWQLVEMTGQIPNLKTTDTAMTWQEFYYFQADGTFVKTRQQNNQELEAKGTYSIQNSTDGQQYVLTYEADSEIIGNCTVEPVEILVVEADDTLVGSWWACDGPGLVYKRILRFD